MGLAEIADIIIDPDQIKTDIVFFKINRADLTAEALADRLKTEGIKVGPKPSNEIRAVTNCHISSEDIDYTLGVFKKVLG